MGYTITLDIDRIECITSDLTEIVNSKKFARVTLVFTEKDNCTDLTMIPIAPEIKIVLNKE